MKFLMPLAIALVGLGAGIGAGLALKPAPAPELAAACSEGPTLGAAEAPPAAEGAAQAAATIQPCPEPDPLTSTGDPAAETAAEVVFVPIEKPFVIPVFNGEKVVAMVVLSLAVEIGAQSEATVEAVEPRLRDSFLAVMFRHANSGGFDGTFTEGQPMDDLRSALLAAARTVITDTPVNEVLITEIARQDV